MRKQLKTWLRVCSIKCKSKMKFMEARPVQQGLHKRTMKWVKLIIDRLSLSQVLLPWKNDNPSNNPSNMLRN